MFLRLLFLLIITSFIHSQEPEWINVSSPYGNINCVLYNKINKTILLGTSKGIWKSENLDFRKLNRIPINNGIKNVSVNLFKKIDETIFACTGKGIYKSINNGYSWLKTSLPDSNFYRILFSEKKVIFAKAFPGPIYSSTDYGDTWNEIIYSDDEKEKKSLDWKHKIYSNKNGDIFICHDSTSYLKSTDNGLNWEKIIVPVNGRRNTENLLLNGEQIIFRTGSYKTYQYVSSFNDGKSWIKMKTPAGRMKHLSLSPNGLLLDVSDPDSLFESTDNGKTWNPISPTVEIRTWDYISEDTLLAIGEVQFGGSVLMLSTDKGKNWVNLASSFNGVKILAGGPNNYLYAGTEWEGAYRSKDFGLTWEPILSAPTINGIAFSGNDLVAISSSLDGIFTLTNNCRTISNASDHGLVDSSIVSLIASPDGSLWAGEYSKFIDIPLSSGGYTLGYKGGGLWCSSNSGGSWYRILLDSTFKTTDNGKSWLKYNEYSHKYKSANQPDLTIHSMGLTPEGNLLVHASVDYKKGLYTSYDQGKTWIKLKELDLYEDVKVNLIKTIRGEIFSGIARSTDGGKTYNEIINGLPSATVNKVLPLLNGDVISATDEGIYYLPYKGNTWHILAFKGAIVNEINIFGEYIFASVDHYAKDRYRESPDIYRLPLKELLGNLPHDFEQEESWTELNTKMSDSIDVLKIDKSGTFWAIYDADKNDWKCNVVYSEDMGKTWIKTPQLDEYIYDFLVDSIHNLLWICTGEGLFYSRIKNVNWEKVNLPLIKTKQDFNSLWPRAIYLDSNGDLFVATSESGPFRNPCTDTSKIVIGYFKPLGFDRIGRLYISKDGGETWGLAESDLPAAPISLFKNKNGKLFVTLDGEGLFYTTNNGNNWNNCNKGLLPKGVIYMCNFGADADRTVGSVKINSDGVMYVIRGARGIARTSDEGKTWEYLPSPHCLISDLYLGPHNKLYLSTENGIYTSIDDGKTWLPFNSGLFSASFKFMTELNGYLIAVSDGGRIYKTKKKVIEN